MKVNIIKEEKMWKSQIKKFIFIISLFICTPSFSEGKTLEECVGSNILTGTLSFLSGVATSELIDWIKEATKYKPELETIMKDFEVCEIPDHLEIQSIQDLTNLDPERPIARCYKYDPYNDTALEEDLITPNTLIEKMFSGNYVLSDKKLFFDNFSDILTVFDHLEKLYKLGEKN